MGVLVLSPYLPHRAVGHGGGIAVRGLVRSLARRHDTTLVSLVRPGQVGLLDEVAELGAKVTGLPFADRGTKGSARLDFWRRRAAALARSWRSRYPFYVEKYWDRSLSRHVIRAVRESRAEAVQVEYLQLSLLLRDLRRWRDALPHPADGPRLVLNTHELGSLPRLRRAACSGGVLRHRLLAEARAWQRLQRDATTWADTTLCVTEQDRRLLAGQGGRDLATVPLGMDTGALAADWRPVRPPRLLFLGSFGHRPNAVAAEFFLARIWPAVAEWVPECRLVLAGPGSDSFLSGRAEQPPRVEALGFVADLTPLFREATLFVAPLTEGGGIKIKILEAMARGLPVVTTPIGAEGIVTEADDAAVIAEPGPDLADAIRAALDDPEACRRRAERARRLMEERYSWQSITSTLVDIYEGRVRVAAPPTAADD